MFDRQIDVEKEDDMTSREQEEMEEER